MSRRLTLYALLILLALFGVMVAVLRHLETGIPFLPGQEKSVWLIEARVDFVAEGGPVSASLSLPHKFLPGFLPECFRLHLPKKIPSGMLSRFLVPSGNTSFLEFCLLGLLPNFTVAAKVVK